MACWKGYRKRGMKKKGDRIVPNCVKEEDLQEKNVPTNPSLWSRMKSRAKSKFDVYPSAYANGWAAKEYKKAGGGWKTASGKTNEETDLSGSQWNKMVSNRQLRDIRKKRNEIHHEFEVTNRNEKKAMKEDLRKWFGDGPKGGWDRYNTKGEKVGKCARDDKDGDGKGDGPKPKCLSNEKASKMSKDEIASSVKAKRAKDGDADRKGKPINVKNKGLDESMSTARSNVGADKCWKGYKAKGTKTKNGREVPNCVKEGKKFDQFMTEASAAWQRKAGKDKEGGLNEKGRKSYERENPGSDLKAPVTKDPSKLDPESKSAKRRKSFCARMGGMEGPMKDDKGKPTRKALALRKWNC